MEMEDESFILQPCGFRSSFSPFVPSFLCCSKLPAFARQEHPAKGRVGFEQQRNQVTKSWKWRTNRSSFSPAVSVLRSPPLFLRFFVVQNSPLLHGKNIQQRVGWVLNNKETK